MQTSKEVEEQFKKELRDLLSKYGAGTEIEAKDHWMGYAECGEDVRMTVCIDGIYKDGETVREYTEIDLGSYFGGKP